MAAMKDEDLTRLLETMPRRTASPSFSDRVLQRLDEQPHRRPRRGFYTAAAAAVACAVVAGSWIGAAILRERAEHRAHAERLETMRQEYRALQSELDELRALAIEAEPVLEIGGTEQVDFVIDLRQLSRQPANARAQPTSHTR